MTQDLKKCVSYVGGEPVVTFEKGDAPGHEFHGNQWVAFSSAANAASVKANASGTADAHEAAARAHERAAKEALKAGTPQSVRMSDIHTDKAYAHNEATHSLRTARFNTKKHGGV